MKEKLLCGIVGAALLAGGAWALGEGDTLLSLTYWNQTLLPELERQMESIAQEPLDRAYQQAKEKIKSPENPDGTEGEVQTKSQTRLTPTAFDHQDQLTLATGASFLPFAGDGVIQHQGVVLDITEGIAVPQGSQIQPGHRYLVGEDTVASLSVQSGRIYLGLQGSYQYVPSGSDAPPFWDISSRDWFYDGVSYVYRQGLLSGTGPDTFEPQGRMTRGMLAAILYRLAGSPREELDRASHSFSDVSKDQWYGPYVSWSVEQGLTAGVGENLFGPEEPVTRQQLLVILHRLALDYLGLSLTERVDLSACQDADQIFSWAEPAVSWAVAYGLIVPDDQGALRPQDPIRRGELSIILKNFDPLFQQGQSPAEENG